jgi:hypothetical protein
MSHTMRDGSTVEDIRLGRVPEFDERSRAFSIAPLVEDRPIVSKGWSVRHWLDQQNTSHCVSFAWHHEALALPARALFADDDVATYAAHQRFDLMQRTDEWAGEDYEGTSVLAGAKVMRSLGYFDEYRWAFTLRDALLAVAYEGPIVIGINWYEGMYDPDEKGFLRPTGDVVGGHAILVSSVSAVYRHVTVWNSWGQSWGSNGRARLSWSALGQLLDEDGDACVPVRRHVV